MGPFIVSEKRKIIGTHFVGVSIDEHCSTIESTQASISYLS